MTIQLPDTTHMFKASDWYWIATDGRIYSSKRNRLVYPYDPAYLAFVASTSKATPWPSDASGVQSAQALVDTLALYGITVTTTDVSSV